MTQTIEEKCLAKGVKLTDQRKIIAEVISKSKEAYGESRAAGERQGLGDRLSRELRHCAIRRRSHTAAACSQRGFYRVLDAQRHA